MKSSILKSTLVVFLTTLGGQAASFAQSPSSSPHAPKHQSTINMDGSAVDTKGVRHSFAVENGKAPWVADEIKSVKPVYPLSARAYQHQGRGLVRLSLDPATGTVTAAGMVKSTGYKELDDAALAAMRVESRHLEGSRSACVFPALLVS